MTALVVLASTWRARLGAAAVALAAMVGWASPLTDHVGYPAALLAGALGSLVAAIVGAGLPAALRTRAVHATGGEVSLALGAYGAALVALSALLAALHGAVTHPCAPARGALYFLLVALPGPVLAALAGAAAGALFRRRWLATLCAAGVPLGAVLWSLARFYASPAIFAYDPFFGFFPGALYDESVPLTATLVTYRLGTVGAITALAALLAWRFDGATAAFGRAAPGRAPALGALITGAALAVGVYVAGPALGHRHDAAQIARALGGQIAGPRCTVLFARSIAGADARLVRDDCELRLAQLEAYFAVPPGGPVTVFYFADAAQKQALMGAEHTYIAKPWRREVYLQHQPFPHPVLKHELAHVVAGAMADGPFRVAARGRIVPLPGLIEGAAVAAAWEGESDASPHEWSRAMLDAGLLPPLRVLTGLGFFTHAAGTAYTAAGSFARWLIAARGAERFHAVYRDGDFARAYAAPLPVLEREWRAFLRTVPVPERVRARARVRFRRAPLQSRICPYETAELLERGATLLAAGELGPARDALMRVVRNDATDVSARTALAEAFTRLGAPARAAALASDADRDLGAAAGARLRARIGDVLFRWRGGGEARAVYAAVDPELFDEDEARTLEFKQWATGARGAAPAPVYTAAVGALLVGERALEPDGAASALALALAFPATRDGAIDAPAAYLIARQLYARQRFEPAAALLAALDPALLPSDRVRAEAVRLRAVALFRAGDRPGARALFQRLADDPSRPRGVRDAALDWLDRIARTRD